MFDGKTYCKVVAYERHDRGEESSDYEYLSSRRMILTDASYERRMYKELAHALDDASTDDNDGVCVVAYAMADGANEFENSSYAVIAYEQQPGRGVTIWHGDEIAEQIQLW